MDQLELERLGIPTISVVTTQFIGLAKTVALSESVLDMCTVIVPHPMGMIPKAEIEKKASDAFPEILKLATEWHPSGQTFSSKPAYPSERFQFTGTYNDVNKLFFDKGWSLGLPIMPPTSGGVNEMLKGTSRKPDEVIGQIPPQRATLTIELVAVHALMAGCKPEYMPVLIAALEGLLVPQTNWRAGLATTGTTQSVVIVNGPIVKEIGIAKEQGAAGKGYHPNGSIGYAINLIAYAVGGSKPPSVDKSTLGSPADYVCWVFGENEDRLPPGWEPLHVDRGFKKSDSVVTVLSSYPPVENIDHNSVTPQEHLRWWSHLISPMVGIGGPCNPSTMKVNPIVALGPEHAQLIASAGWSKDDFRQAFWEQARIPMSAWPSGCHHAQEIIENMGAFTPESMIPITFKPEQFLIVIAGGDGKHSHYFAPFPGSTASSRLITK
ncbi:UGSC family (seleno)protein [Chloroflexota bacterium]